MIERLKVKRGMEQDSVMQDRQVGATRQMKDWFTEDLFVLPEVDFEDWIRRNYDCSIYDPEYHADIAAIEVNSEQRTAYQDYSKIVGALGKSGVELQDCQYGFTDLLELEEEIGASEHYRNVLGALDALFKLEDPASLSPRKMTRTVLLSVFYYYFNDRMLNIGCGSFKSLFKRFQREIGPLFERAGYTPFSGKNLIDVLTAFASYNYIKSVV